MVLVTFKNSYDETVCIMVEKFKTAKEAKQAIEEDGYAFALAHRNGECKGSSKWIEPNGRDFFKVVGKDGSYCIYQYFIMN